MFKIDEILKVTNGKLSSGSDIMPIKGISIDSRTLKKGELFIAIKGKIYDGHDFVKSAFKSGACGAIVCRRSRLLKEFKKMIKSQHGFVILVKDTLKTLGAMAGFHRKRFDIPVVAITGSNGKTTAKEMTANILQDKWPPLKNSGTQNNLIGVPLTLLKLCGRNKSAVLELGMNRAREIKTLAEMSCPNIGVITNIGPAHLEYLKSLQAVYQAKKELLDFLGRGDTALLNNDDAFLRHFKKKGLKIFTFSINAKSDFQAKDIEKKKTGWKFFVNNTPYFIQLPAYHDIYNALVAISVGTLFNVNFEKIRNALSYYTSLEKRMVRSSFNGIELIDDTYNSNPLSMESAIKTLRDIETSGKKILVSGDMLELGRKAVYYHRKIGRLVAQTDINNFIGVGELMRNSLLAAKKDGMKNAWFCRSKEEAASLLKQVVRSDDVVLVKGSRAMQMEEVIRCFTTSFTR